MHNSRGGSRQMRRGGHARNGRGGGRGGRQQQQYLNGNGNSNGGNYYQQNQRSFKHRQWVRQDSNASQRSRSPVEYSPSNNYRQNGGLMTNAQRAKRFGATDKSILYDQLKRNRVHERQAAIKARLIPDPNVPMRLEDAIDFRGTCQTMCPEFERVEREVQNMLDPLEMDESGHADPAKTVKRYRRSAAGNEQPLPSDVRPPEVLKKTLDYLIDSVMMKYPLEKCHAFLWDRTRSIRQDFTLQNIRDISAVQIHERIARFHILCLHEMCQYGEEKFSEQQETEQLRKVLLSLMEFYDDLREEGVETENEAEFRAYYLITHIHDHDIARQTMRLPRHVFFHPYMQRALRFYELLQRNNEILQTSERRNKFLNVEACQNYYTKFFKLIGDKDTPFLMACMLEWHFPDVRKGALKAMNRAYLFRHSGVEVEYLRQALAYDSVKHLLAEAQLYGLIVDTSSGTTTIRFGQKHYKTRGAFFIEPLSNPRQRKSMLLVDPKKGGRTFREIVNGERADIAVRTTENVFKVQQANLPGSGKIYCELLPSKRVLRKPPPAEEPPKPSEAVLEAARLREEAERQRLLEIEIEKAKKAEMEEKARQQQLEAEIRRRQQEEEEQRQRARALAAAEEAARQERDRQQAREAALKEQRRIEMIDRLSEEIMRDLWETILEEQAKVVAVQTRTRLSRLKRKVIPWVERARSRVEKRNYRIQERNSLCRLVARMIQSAKPKKNSEETTEYTEAQEKSMARQSKECLRAEGAALRRLKMLDQPACSPLVWEPENFAEQIYPRIKKAFAKSMLPKNNTSKYMWQMWIHVADRQQDSAKWFSHKFGLDSEFSRRVEYMDDVDITIRSVDPTSCIYPKIVDELGAVIFSLADMRTADSDDCTDVEYWKEEKERLDKLSQQILQHNPAVRVPFVFAYWPKTESLRKAVDLIPRFLNLEHNPVVHNYHILIMNPYTIGERLHEEMEWLATNTVINENRL